MSEQRGELGVGSVRSRLDRAHCDAELGGDLGVSDSVQMLQSNDGGLVRRQRLDGPPHLPHRVQRVDVRRQRDDGGMVGGDVVQRVRLAPRLATMDVERGALRDRRQPRTGVAVGSRRSAPAGRARTSVAWLLRRDRAARARGTRPRTRDRRRRGTRRVLRLGSRREKSSRAAVSTSSSRIGARPVRRPWRTGRARSVCDCDEVMSKLGTRRDE